MLKEPTGLSLNSAKGEDDSLLMMFTSSLHMANRARNCRAATGIELSLCIGRIWGLHEFASKNHGVQKELMSCIKSLSYRPLDVSRTNSISSQLIWKPQSTARPLMTCRGGRWQERSFTNRPRLASAHDVVSHWVLQTML